MQNNLNDVLQPAGLTTAPLNHQSTIRAGTPPETFRLPRQKERDPFWGLSRAWYYSAEKHGLIKLIRLRKVGNQRGVTLVPYQAVASIVKTAADLV